MRRRLALTGSAAAIAFAAAVVALPGAASAAPGQAAVVLVNQPAASICTGRTFTVGVWYQQASGGSRAYRIAVTGPRGIRFFYRHGIAPASGWRRWKIRAGRSGEYRTAYSSHRPGSQTWSRYVAITVARRCSGREPSQR